MPDTRKKDANWNLIVSAEGKCNVHQCHLAVLMDIRDELKQLNNVFACWRFQGIPRVLDRIARNTAKPRKKKKQITKGGS